MPNGDLNITLKAKNSSGEQKLWLAVQDINNGEVEYFWTLTGEYEGKKIQIDFDITTRAELEEIREMVDLILSA